jgi:hypothetical protein
MCSWHLATMVTLAGGWLVGGLAVAGCPHGERSPWDQHRSTTVPPRWRPARGAGAGTGGSGMAGWLESTTGIPSRGRSTGRNACACMAKSKSTCAVSALAQQPPASGTLTGSWHTVQSCQEIALFKAAALIGTLCVPSGIGVGAQKLRCAPRKIIFGLDGGPESV